MIALPAYALLKRELLVQLRRRRTFFWLMVLATLSSCLVLAGWPSSDYLDWSGVSAFAVRIVFGVVGMAFLGSALIVPGVAAVIHARGVVRWSNDHKDTGEPVGMGIEFIETSTEAKEQIGEYIRDRIAGRQIDRLTQTPLHVKFLRLHARKVGESFSVDVLAKFFDATHKDILQMLTEFSCFRLVEFQEDQVYMRASEHPEIQTSIQSWLEDHPPEPGS